MAKPMPRAGRPHKTPGSKSAPRAPGLTSGSLRDRAALDEPVNPLGRVNGPEGGTGRKPPTKVTSNPPLPNQGGAGS